MRQIGVSEQTYYRWRKEYSGIQVGDIQRIKALEKENVRLKNLMVDLNLDTKILKYNHLKKYIGSTAERRELAMRIEVK